VSRHGSSRSSASTSPTGTATASARSSHIYCRGCSGFHFYPPTVYVEFLASETDRLRRIVASSFNRIGTQFVRYDTGDLAVPAVGGCTNNFLRTGAIAGRSQETFIDGSGRSRALGPYVFGIHGSFWDHIRDLQFVQDRPGFLLVRVVTNPRADRHQIEKTLEERLPMVKLEFEYVPLIERNPNGKRRYFIGHVQPSARPTADRSRDPRRGTRT
jgi:phenylacetate-coenzyme A ligase PaaK-like adenylate-forming protein